MDIKLHYNATTTPKIRHYIQTSLKSDNELAQELGISVLTVKKWRKRSDIIDRSHTPNKIHRTLTLEQQFLLLYFRQRLSLSIDELLILTRQLVNRRASRAGVSRCLQKQNVTRIDRNKLAGQAGFVLLDLVPLPNNLVAKTDFLLIMIEKFTGFIRFSRLDWSISKQASVWNYLKQSFPVSIQKIQISSQSSNVLMLREFADKIGVEVVEILEDERINFSETVNFNQDFTKIVNGELIDPRLGFDAQLLACEDFLNYRLPRGRLNKCTPAAYLEKI